MMANDEQKAPRPFEPPPWEKELYGEPSPKEGEQADRDAGPTARETVGAVRESLGDRKAAPEAATEDAPAEAEDVADVAEKMLFELAAEESVAGPTHVWAWSLGVGVIVGLIGLSMATYSVVALSRTYSAGVTALAGSSIIGMFGLIMAGMGAWVAVRSLNKRGEI